MKVFNILGTAALFSSTFSWAKNLEDLKSYSKDIITLQKQHEKIDKLIKYLENEATERDTKIAQLEEAIAQNKQQIFKNEQDIYVNKIQAYDNILPIEDNTHFIGVNAEDIQTNKVAIDANKEAIEVNTADISQNKEDITENSEDVAAILAQNNLCIDDYYSQTGEYCGEWQGATIRRLAVWGQGVNENDIEFMWPNEQLFQTMTPDVKLQSLQFKARGSINSVQVTLSNGEQSAVFQNPPSSDYEYYHDLTIDFSQLEPIRSVNGHSPANNSIEALTFHDSAGQIAAKFDPYDTQIPGQYNQEYRIFDNEELIGVYGAFNQTTRFSSFGFLVKQKQQ